MSGSGFSRERRAGVTAAAAAAAVLSCIGVAVAAYVGAARWNSGRPTRRMLGVSFSA